MIFVFLWLSMISSSIYVEPEITCSPKTPAGRSHPAIQHTARNRRMPVNISATAFLFVR